MEDVEKILPEGFMIRNAFAISLCLCVMSGVVSADTFGTGANQFTIDFVSVSGSTNPTSGYGIVNNDYRMGKYEITNAQWNKFKAAYGPVTGSVGAYSWNSYYTSDNVPVNRVSWYEAAQFVNFLNTSTGHQAAYKFTGTQGTSDYTLGVWNASDTGYNAANPYRNSNAFYFLPTENEWVKAAYWNGTSLQVYATKAGESLYQGNGSNGGWNYSFLMQQPWAVGSGSQELNGTYDMMGNVWEWMESPYYADDYISGSNRGLRGGSSIYNFEYGLTSFFRGNHNPVTEDDVTGFRVASVPEPASALLMLLGAAWMGAKRKR